MPSGFRSGTSWVVSFRGLRSKKARRVRVPLSVIPFDDDPQCKAAADALATECERYCRMLEKTPTGPDLDHAEHIRAITEEQAATLRQSGIPTPEIDPADPLRVTILRAAESHPSSGREPIREEKKHRAYLQAFSTWSGVTLLHRLTLPDVTRWIGHLRARGLAFETRRHYLLWLRRAGQMASHYGLPNVLPRDLPVDRREAGEQVEVHAWTLLELGRALRYLAPSRVVHGRAQGRRGARTPEQIAADRMDHRPRMAVVLGGFHGLRPSECTALLCGKVHLIPAYYATGRKTDASVRELPLAPLALAWMRPLVEGQPADAPVFRCWDTGAPFGDVSWPQWLMPLLESATGSPGKAKDLRKSFATWTSEYLPGHITEAWLGHRDPRVTAMTGSRYRARRGHEALRASALQIERLMLRAMHRAWAVDNLRHVSTKHLSHYHKMHMG